MKYMAIAVFIVFFLFSFSFADIINVPADTSTIQGGIYLATEGDTVLVAENTYYENINFKGKAITVASMFILDEETSHISKTIINGSQPIHPDSGAVVSFVTGEDTTSIICGFTITGGSGNKVYAPSFPIPEIEGGGGIHLFESGAEIRNNIIINNNINSGLANGPSGGGIAALNIGSISRFVIIRNCQISSNTVTGKMPGGGGIIAAPLNINYIIENNIVSNNRVYCTDSWKAMGGGINVDHTLPTSGNMIIRNNIIKGNEVHGVRSFGGGLYIVLWEVDETTYDCDPNPIIYNNIISDNYSEWKGGAITIWMGTYQNTPPSENLDMCPQPALINNTIVNNRAARGSGIYCYSASFLLMNNILWNDLFLPEGSEIDSGITGNSTWDRYPNDGNEIHMYHSDIQGGWEGGGNLDTYPAFEDTSSGEYSLSVSSVCIGRGIDSVMVKDTWYYCPSLDYNGNPRPYIGDGFVDMGAIESPYDQVDNITTHDLMLPLKFELSQNYPNPFNPSTMINYQLPKTSDVEISIYNLLGQTVATLVDSRENAGTHQVEWDASAFASGIYYYRIEAGEFQDVKKMILLR